MMNAQLDDIAQEFRSFGRGGRRVIAALLLAAVLAVPARPQTPDEGRIVLAAATALRAELPEPLAFDPRITAFDIRAGESWVGSWPPGMFAALVHVLGATPVEIERIRRCAVPRGLARPREALCSLRDFDAHLSLSKPVVDGDDATVLARIQPDDASLPRRQLRWLVRLTRDAATGHWHVVDKQWMGRGDP